MQSEGGAKSLDLREEARRLNQGLLAAIEDGGEAFISNVVIDGKYRLRFCVVNFRASSGDMEAMPELVVVRSGRQVYSDQNSHFNKP